LKRRPESEAAAETCGESAQRQAQGGERLGGQRAGS